MQASQSRQKRWKEWHFISQSMTQPAEVTCMVIVTTRVTYCSQSTINSFNLFQCPYLQNRDFWESIVWCQETKSIISDPKCSGVAAGVQWCSVVVRFYIGMSECWVVLYQCCHEFTHYCVIEYKHLKQKMLPSHSLHCWDFFSMTMKILILPGWKSFSVHVFHSVLSLLSSCGGFCGDELSNALH